ncbi:EamA family transporter [Corynebacterium ammoniagenes]|uniref:Membrane protein n=1 Tax=Corynebacterium ammoniagenes DSM 20306 TaxID=649754 RepID=A0ABN0ADQ5_CORAM|nr:EamA family transporter [Corynebacterium ammoniagenes]AQS73033.1 EamA family transporter [Corynebacterium ammoniagenes]EFG80912.1 putative membrane protein [Corynebacterium ammoniagenes DSM 20306]
MTHPLAVVCIIGSCISLQLGAALAIQLFPVAGAWGTAAVRLLLAGLILLVLTRPKFHTWTRKQWLGVALFGASRGLMNGFFYNAINHIPLGTAVTIEFLGPLALAAFLSRTLRDAACVALALIGMVLLGVDSWTGEALSPLGVAFALIAGVFWVCYILASKKVGVLVPGQGGLAVALIIGGLLILPVSGTQSLVIFSTWNFVAIAVGTAVLASLIPYSLELVALRRLAPNAFSILISLEPVFAGLFGWILLAQNLSVLKISAIVLVVMASILQTLSASAPAARSRVRSKAA